MNLQAPCPHPVSRCSWPLLPEGLATRVGGGHCLLRPSAQPGLEGGLGLRGGGRRQEVPGTRPGDALSCGSVRQGRLPSRQDGIRFHSAESSSQVYKSQPPPPLLSVFFFPPTFTVLFSWLQKSPLLASLGLLPPSFLSLPCVSLSEGTAATRCQGSDGRSFGRRSDGARVGRRGGHRQVLQRERAGRWGTVGASLSRNFRLYVCLCPHFLLFLPFVIILFSCFFTCSVFLSCHHFLPQCLLDRILAWLWFLYPRANHRGFLTNRASETSLVLVIGPMVTMPHERPWVAQKYLPTLPQEYRRNKLLTIKDLDFPSFPLSVHYPWPKNDG